MHFGSNLIMKNDLHLEMSWWYQMDYLVIILPYYLKTQMQNWAWSDAISCEKWI